MEWVETTIEKSSLTDRRGCSVPLSAAPPQPENSEKLICPKFTLQSTAFGMQMPLSFQLPPTLIDFESLLNVLSPTDRWFTMWVPVESQETRWTSASNVSSEAPLNGAGRPTGPVDPGPTLSFARLNK